MIRVVLDTNVIVSALLRPDGLQAVVLLLALRGDVELCVSEEILAEYDKVLRRPRFELQPREIDRSLAAIRAASRVVHPTTRLTESPDESDNRIYECADAAAADFIVTGNTKHFKKAYKHTQIVNGRQLLDLLA
jgi:putative PIN family toxin of toxin-antitoxin system